jgi:hypothetical protein
MSRFESAALLLLAANLAMSALLVLLLRRRTLHRTSRVEEQLEAIGIRLAEASIAQERFANVRDGDPPSIDDAVARAAGFLRRRLRSGAYGLACVGSDGAARFSHNKGHVFVAAFIAQALAGLLDETERTIILVRILSEESEGKWGFSPPGACHDEQFRLFHVDSDDTAYVIRTLRLLGVNRAPDCLTAFHREAEGLFLTFDAPHPARLTTEQTPENNLLAHPEVNANVFLALAGTHLQRLTNRDALRSAQEEYGNWKSYFYPSPIFGTLLALEVLEGDGASATAVKRALSFIADSQNADGSWGEDGDAHETALAVTALSGREAHAVAVRRGVEHLLATMGGDGSWASPACVWEFHATAADVWRAYDAQRSYVSARCMIALRAAAPHMPYARP